MSALGAAEAFAALPDTMSSEEYNFTHFRFKHIWNDTLRTLNRDGLVPGEPAPDFTLPRAGGGELRLSDLRGRPVLLHIGSVT